MESDVSYFRRRALEEKAAALDARDVQARQAHLDMAARYEDLVHGIITHDQSLDSRWLSETGNELRPNRDHVP